ncbi:MAG: hypothetical protein C4520_04450 [Candidatus Abyssobacteria bacterium SURF_5]|uniref:YprB ribonuclease H-like domain-containing protein n=1 Tax=Abyssobacteria bacterium (strain SURF_5) TaxID=2093360 RepID=A0A3A4NUN7_ABYX5|nr:MAG: hypothetical protein C4520_04450 [Candidatus Abyssubacteria bacterium SURF_5]
MNLRDKLDRYTRPAKPETIPAPASSLSSSSLCEHSVHTFPADYRHGTYNFQPTQKDFPHALEFLFPNLGNLPLSFDQIAFFDTETTGLSGGIGVCAFLVGIAYLSPNGFVVEQYLLNDFPSECDLLQKVCAKLDQFRYLASFNGRSFDVPVIEGRFVLNGVPQTISKKLHLDMLHPARRLWKHRLKDCSLKTVEADILKFQRLNDIDGWMIPQAFFSYLRSADRNVMERILLHNRLDLLTLACITHLILKAVENPREADFEHGEDWYGLGTLFERRRQVELAASCFERALEAGLPDPLGRNCRKLLSLTHKRAGNWDGAVRLWKEDLSKSGASAIFELEELAKYYEHRRRDFASACEACRRAITALEIREATSGAGAAALIFQFEQRLQRLRRKMQREKVCEKQESMSSYFSSYSF